VLLFSHWAYADDGLKAYWDAAQEFQQQIEQKAVAGSVPRLSDAKAEHLFSILSDHKRFLHKRKYGLKDVAELSLVCRKNTELLMHYMMFGVKEALQDTRDPQQIIEVLQILAAKNSIVYQNEAMAFLPFSVYCSARLIPLASEIMSSLKKEEITEIRLQGIRQMKAGIFNIYEGLLRVLNQIEINHAHKLYLAKALADSSEQYLSFIPLDERAKIIAVVKETQKASAPDVRRQLDKIITTLSSKECGWVCQLDI
jgi:hypothetical protein